MNICDTRQMNRVRRSVRNLKSEGSPPAFQNPSRPWPSFHSFFCWALLVCILLFMGSGCGRYKEELEGAKQQIEKLNSQVKKLTEEVAGLTQEKSRLGAELQSTSEQNKQMQQELKDLNKTKASLSSENQGLKQKNSKAEEEIASLKREKAKMAQEVEELEKRVSDMSPPPNPPATVPAQDGAKAGEQSKNIDPCDAVVAFMKASEKVVRQHKGPERSKLLEQVKQQYEQGMKDAPVKAVKAAEDWVKEGTRFWDKPHGESTFRLLNLRNTVLDTCGKSLKEAGF